MQDLPDKLYKVESVVKLEQIAIHQFAIPAYELMKRAGEAHPMQIASVFTGCMPHQQPDQIIRQHMHGDLLADHIETLGTQHVHPEGRFQVAEIEFGRPTIAVQRPDIVGRRFDGIEQCGHDHDRSATKAFRGVLDTNKTNGQCLR